MRNFLLLSISIIALSLNSCSKDDGNENNSVIPRPNTISFKVNGTQKNFNATVIDLGNFIQIKSIDDDNPVTESVFFNIHPYETSNSDIQSFRYRTPEGEYNTINTTFENYSVTSNPTNKTSSGTFSGPVTLIGGNGESLNITDGTFYVKY